MKRMTICAFCWLILLAFGCDKDEPSITQTATHSLRAGDVEFSLLVTDLEGKPQTVFKVGENFLLSFKVRNHSNKEVKVCEGSLLDKDKIGEQLFTVYRVTNEANSTGLIGKPYESISAFCRVYTSSMLMPQSENTLTLPWLWGRENQQDFYDTSDFGLFLDSGYACETSAYYSAQAPRTTALATGKYFTQISATVDNRKINLRYDFTVE